jgi:hypothetical protein
LQRFGFEQAQLAPVRPQAGAIRVGHGAFEQRQGAVVFAAQQRHLGSVNIGKGLDTQVLQQRGDLARAFDAGQRVFERLVAAGGIVALARQARNLQTDRGMVDPRRRPGTKRNARPLPAGRCKSSKGRRWEPPM